jgi:glycosyltransferase involved in cell wall biosynthesis
MPENQSRLSGECIVCLAPDPWGGLWRNRHQIMTRLARHNTVLYVEPRLYLWDALRRFRDGRLRLNDLRRPLAEHYQDGLWVYHDPYYAPFAGRLSGGSLTRALRRRAMLRNLRDLGAGSPILWLLRPFQADQIGQLAEKLLVYHVTDEYRAYPYYADLRTFQEQEEALLRRADLVIVTSPTLLASRRPFNSRTYLVPNAVDYAGFQRILIQYKDSGADEPLPGWPSRPRIGYVGALNEKVDYVLLAGVARSRPDWHIVLIGATELSAQPDKADVLRGLPNVHWFGQRPVAELPPAIADLDVCVLPYELNEWTAGIDSLKLYEYLACGRPIVSADISAARSFAELVRIAHGPAEFSAQIEAALSEDDPASVERRKAVAAANTWDHRVAQIEALLVQALAAKRRAP